MSERFSSGSSAAQAASFRMVIAPQRSGADPEAWKKLIGQKPVTARLSTLPEKKVSTSALASSAAFQGLLVVLLFALPIFFPQKLMSKLVYEVVPLATPQTEVLLPPPPPVIRAKTEPTPPLEEPPAPQRVAKLIVPPKLVPPRVKPPEVRTPDVPVINQALARAELAAPSAAPARPREPVKTGLLTTGSAAPATVNAPISKVQTGGFGDPNGLPGPSDPNKRPNIGHFGSPALPTGPGEGNGTGGANGIRGTVASAGFGSGVAIAPQGGSGNSRGEVKSGGFAAATAEPEPSKPKAAESAAAVQPVVILEKPNPVYSDEARKLGIEGEVLVEVVFTASGEVQVGRVVKSLGHGLDEAATRAARQIRFKPALQNEKPVNFPAVIHIVFQLAF